MHEVEHLLGKISENFIKFTKSLIFFVIKYREKLSNCFNLKLKCNGRKQFTFFLRCYMIAQCKHAAQSGVKANRIAFSIRFVVFNKKILFRRFSAKSFPETMSKRKSKVETISAEILVLNVCDHWMIIVTEYSIQEKRLSESILIFSGPVFTGSNINRVY